MNYRSSTAYKGDKSQKLYF